MTRWPTIVHLILKGLPYSGLCLIALAGGWLTYVFDRGGGVLRPQAAYMMGFFLVVGVSGALVNRELIDAGAKGYAFLRTLPVTDREIVTSKFALSLFDVCLCWFVVLVQSSVLQSSPTLFVLHAAYITLWSLLALLIASLWHVGIYAVGFGRTALPLTVLLLVVLLPLSLVLDQVCDFEATGGFPPAVYALTGAHWAIWAAIVVLVLLGYYGLMRAAARIKAASEAYL